MLQMVASQGERSSVTTELAELEHRTAEVLSMLGRAIARIHPNAEQPAGGKGPVPLPDGNVRPTIDRIRQNLMLIESMANEVDNLI